MTQTYAGKIAHEREAARSTALGVIVALSASHLLNDVMQSLAPALYPVFCDRMALSFFQSALITFVFQLTASLLQPLIGLSLDRRPMTPSCLSAWPSPWSACCCSPSPGPIL